MQSNLFIFFNEENFLSLNLIIPLQNPEITDDREKFYLQLTAYTTSGAVVVANGAGYSGDQFLVRLIDVKDTQDWGILYFYYELVKID